MKMLRPTIPASIEIVLKLCEEELVLNADKTQMHQVLMNLATNACQAMSEKGSRMEIGVEQMRFDDLDTLGHPDLEPGCYARIYVSDDGAGILWAHRDFVFDPYFTTKEPGKGTGLGLAVVQGIIKAHQGHITCQSELGKGAVFEVYMPLVEKAPVPKYFETDDEVVSGKGHLLIVDDEPSITRLMKQNLERIGYRVTDVNRSEDALKSFSRKPHAYAAVITDMTMPHMNGDELAQKIKALNPGTPVILCTGFSEKMNAAKAEAMGIDAFLTKPMDIRKLSQAVRKVLGRTGS